MSLVINFDYSDLNGIPIEIRSLLPHEIYRLETTDAIRDAIAEVWAQIRQMGDDNDELSSDEGSHGNGDTDEGSHCNSDADGSDQGLDSDDASFEWRTFKRSRFEYPFKKHEINDFYNRLPENFVFDMGFRVLGLKPNDEKNCWCPWYVN